MIPMSTTIQADGALFSVNFIRHRVIPRRVRTALMYAVLVYLLVNAAGLLSFVGSALTAHKRWTHLQATLQGRVASASEMAALRQEIDALHDQATEDLAKLQKVTALKRQRFPLAKRLAVVTATLPARTWVTSVSTSRETRVMTIGASYLIDPEAPYKLPLRSWLEALKADDYFRRGLKRLELSQSARKPQGRSALFTAELVAEWDPDE